MTDPLEVSVICDSDTTRPTSLGRMDKQTGRCRNEVIATADSIEPDAFRKTGS
jgi:hypothetical protein